MKYNNQNTPEFDKFFSKVMSDPVKYRGAIHEYISTGEIPDLKKYEELQEDIIDMDELNKNVEKLTDLDEGIREADSEENGLEIHENYSIVQMEKKLPNREKVIQEGELVDLKILLESSGDVGEFLKKI